MFVKYAGPFTKLTISHTKRSATRSVAIAGMTYVVYERRAASAISVCA
jgi:hypothetical protein